MSNQTHHISHMTLPLVLLYQCFCSSKVSGLACIGCRRIHTWFSLLLSSAETPAPFAVNENTTELVVTAPLDREESERYRLLLVCTVRTEAVITKVETSLDVFVDDEDDNAPYVNGTDTADVIISFNRTIVRFTPHRSDQFWWFNR